MINGFVNIVQMDWDIGYYNDDVQQAILALLPSFRARYIHLTERMLTFGPDLGMPHTRAMGKGLFELRLKSKEGIARVLFCNRAWSKNSNAGYLDEKCVFACGVSERFGLKRCCGKPS
jgi:Phage derived protein Gp49-like (DUF891)